MSKLCCSLHAKQAVNILSRDNEDLCFTAFEQDISNYQLPEKFTFPFYYQPNILSKIASEELQVQLQKTSNWQHDFAITGKMFGVLVVKNQRNEVGYLAAFSGKIEGDCKAVNFVPAIFDMYRENTWYCDEQLAINKLNDDISQLENSDEHLSAKTSLAAILLQSEQAIAEQQLIMRIAKKGRKVEREKLKITLTGEKLALALEKVNQASVQHKNTLRDLKATWLEKEQLAKYRLKKMTDILKLNKRIRKERSAKLQQQLFSQYQLLNAKGDCKDLHEVFTTEVNPVPPSGAGDCAAPKLLQYAYAHHLTPIAMAEFWWGAAPKSEVRQHRNFYPACQSKCQPILSHMLEGLVVEDNPMHQQKNTDRDIEIIYQDDAILVINKPHELLSVPGKTIRDSVFERLRQQFPQASGPLIVHRLDMSTSGLMLITLTKRANKRIQKQFIHRSIKKRYVALLDGNVEQDTGVIELPLIGDIDDRPRQKVCFEHGKPALSHWQVIARENNQTKVFLYPKTGRTHQLRVHCAHTHGLNIPIVGDDLYGKRGERLHLHAQFIAFYHPISNEPLEFCVDAPF